MLIRQVPAVHPRTSRRRRRRQRFVFKALTFPLCTSAHLATQTKRLLLRTASHTRHATRFVRPRFLSFLLLLLVLFIITILFRMNMFFHPLSLKTRRAGRSPRRPLVYTCCFALQKLLRLERFVSSSETRMLLPRFMRLELFRFMVVVCCLPSCCV